MTADKKKTTDHLNSYVRYSGMAFQMAVIIAGGVIGGVKLDEWLNLKPLFTLVCAVASIAVALYLVIRDALRGKK